MKTHEIGIGSFASVMINGKEKHWDSRERWIGERLHFSVCAAECARSCAFNEESKQGRQKEKQRGEDRVNERKKAPFAYSHCQRKTFVPPRAPHQGCTPENSTHQSRFWRKNHLDGEKNLGRISRSFLLLFVQPILDGFFKWCTSWHITTAARTAITSFWLRAPSRVFLLSVFTMHEPDLSHPSAPRAWGWRQRELCVCVAVHLSVVQVQQIMKVRIKRVTVDSSKGWLLSKCVSVCVSRWGRG